MDGGQTNFQCIRSFQEKAEEKAAQRAYYALQKENINGESKKYALILMMTKL